MLALRYYKAKDMRLEDIQTPRPGRDEVLIKIAYAGVCGTDIEEYLYGPIWMSQDRPHPITGKTTPVVLGHEFSGYIEEAGDRADDFKKGDRVAVHPILPCGECDNCRQGKNYICKNVGCVGLHLDGGFEEYCTVPAKQVFKVPDRVRLDHAALAEPIGFCINSFEMTDISMGDDVVIYGAGGIGLICIQIAKAAGAKRVIMAARRDLRLGAAKQMGADVVIDVSKEDCVKRVLELTDGKGADVVVEATGNPGALDIVFDSCKSGGKVALLSVFFKNVEFDFKKIVNYGRTVVGAVAHNPVHFETALQMLSDGRVNVTPLVSIIVSLRDALDQGFEEYIKNKQDYIKMIIKP